MVWNIWIIFPYIGNVIIPTDWLTHIFQRGRYTTNQYCTFSIFPGVPKNCVPDGRGGWQWLLSTSVRWPRDLEVPVGTSLEGPRSNGWPSSRNGHCSMVFPPFSEEYIYHYLSIYVVIHILWIVNHSILEAPMAVADSDAVPFPKDEGCWPMKAWLKHGLNRSPPLHPVATNFPYLGWSQGFFLTHRDRITFVPWDSILDGLPYGGFHQWG